MRFAYGYTRFVVLFGKWAIKFARIPLLLVLPRLLMNLISPEKKKIFRERFGPLPSGIMTYLCRGLDANRREFGYYQEYPDDEDIMPVHKMFYGGFILIQPRGSVITRDEFEAECSLGPELTEARKHWQFARNAKGKLVLIDYGCKETCLLLSARGRQQRAA